MEDIRKIFDVTRLDENQLGCLEFLVNSPAYYEVVEPYIMSIRDSLNQKLLDPSRERKEEYPDDFLRGGVIALDGLLHFFKKIVQETRFERIDKATRGLDASQQYTHEQTLGQHVPVLGANESLEVEPDHYDPAEDF